MDGHPERVVPAESRGGVGRGAPARTSNSEGMRTRLLALLALLLTAAAVSAAGRYGVTGTFTCGATPVQPRWAVAVYRPSLKMVKVLFFSTPYSAAELERAKRSEGAWAGDAALVLHLQEPVGKTVDVSGVKTLAAYLKCPGEPCSESLIGRFVPQALSRLDLSLKEGGTLKMTSAYDFETFKWQVDVNTVVHVVP